jgi:hypothetical protein
MVESLVCILWSSVEDKRKVFEASGRREFKTELKAHTLSCSRYYTLSHLHYVRRTQWGAMELRWHL